MSIRIRANATEDPVNNLHVHRYPAEWAQFNQARRICQMDSQDARRAFVANLRFKETPQYMIDLDVEVRRQWPLRKAPLVIPPALVALMEQSQQSNTVVE
ncbi:hypothetical protein ACEN9F_13470 [Duganella sp. CT11-25]|uniref:hypothetical protein n=1 Tax=unclassified Duganella TaxID=2636909 RepID=UPI0039B0AEBA